MSVLTGTGKRLRDFTLQIPILDQSNNPVGRHNPITLVPRYTDSSTAHTKTFTAAGDYADSSSHNVSGSGWSYDFKVDWPGPGAWYNYTYQTTHGQRGSSGSPNNGTSLGDYGAYMSVYADLAIGSSPHPGIGTSYAHMSILYNQHGAYFPLQYTSPPPVDYTQARTWPEQSSAGQNFKVAGQKYSTTHDYRQWFCLGDVQTWYGNSTSYLRFINWGGNSNSTVGIYGLTILIHGVAGASSGADA